MQLRSLSIAFAARLFDTSAEPVTAAELDQLSPGIRSAVRLSQKARPVVVETIAKGRRPARRTIMVGVR